MNGAGNLKTTGLEISQPPREQILVAVFGLGVCILRGFRWGYSRLNATEAALHVSIRGLWANEQG